MAVSTIQSDLEIYGNIQSQGEVVISGSIKGNVAAKAVDVKDSDCCALDGDSSSLPVTEFTHPQDGREPLCIDS